MTASEHRGEVGFRQRAMSPITRRILAVNILAGGLLVAGLLFLGEYRRGLVEQELASLANQADLFAAAIGESAVVVSLPGQEKILPEVARQIIRRLNQANGSRARLFDGAGNLLVDSRLSEGPGGAVQVEALPPPPGREEVTDLMRNLYDRFGDLFPGPDHLPLYQERLDQSAKDFIEVRLSLLGEKAQYIRRDVKDTLLLSAAVPVQRYKHVVGSLMLTRDSTGIDQSVFQVRLAIITISGVALAVTMLLSMYLAASISSPLKRLAAAANRVRQSQGRQHDIPDLDSRDDEIGDLSLALREMTHALWARMDAVEGFAADVAHEIKNPLTSLRSAVETAARIKDPDQQKQLMAIIQEDVSRLDRLISDISDASRLDAELSRAEMEAVDIGRMLGTLTDVYQITGKGDGAVQLRFELSGTGEDGPDLSLLGIEGRLVQVFRNLIGNAISFSPPGGLITLRARRDGDWIEASVEDEGPGLPPGKEAAIFDRFYSERPEGEKFGTHSGLGLSISRQIVEAHNGQLWAENRHLRDATGPRVAGARFVVRLPAAPTQPSRDKPKRGRKDDEASDHQDGRHEPVLRSRSD